MLLHEKNLRKLFLAFKDYLLNHQVELGGSQYLYGKDIYSEKIKNAKRFNDLRSLSAELSFWDLVFLSDNFYRIEYNGNFSSGQGFSWKRFYEQMSIFAKFVEPNSELMPRQFIQDNGYWSTGKWVFRPCYQNGYYEQKFFAGYTKPTLDEVDLSINLNLDKVRLNKFFKEKSKMQYTVPADRINIVFDSNLETLIHLTDFTSFTNQNKTETESVYLFPQITICIPNCDWCRCEIYEVVAGVIQIDIGTSILTKTNMCRSFYSTEINIAQKFTSYYCFQTSTGWRVGDLLLDTDQALITEIEKARFVELALEDKK